MKRIVLAVMLFIMIYSVSSFSNESGVRVIIDKNEVPYDDTYGYPYIDEQHRTQVPFRKTLEAIGAEVQWLGPEQTAVASLDGMVIKIALNKSHIKVNDETVRMDTQALVKNGRIYLPIRFVLEAFGYDIKWDQTLGGVVARDISSSNEIGNPSLKVKDIVLSPSEMGSKELLLAYTLEDEYKHSKVLVFDSTGSFIRTYLPSHNLEQKMYVTLSDLDRDATYEYVIESRGEVSAKYEFKTFDEKDTEILFLGDPQGYLDYQYKNLNIVVNEALNHHDIELIMMAGDLVDTGDAKDQWQSFHNHMNDIVAEIPFAPAQGNHDTYGSNDVYLKTFNLPDNGHSKTYETYYFDLPGARVAILNTEGFDNYSEQALWLKNIMAESDSRFKIVMMHRAPYPMRYNETFTREWAGVFEETGIDLVLTGHDHIYSRTRMEEGQLDPNGITYIVGGSSSGSKFYSEDVSVDRYWKEVIYDEDNPVYVHLKIDDKTIVINSYAYVKGESVLIDSLDIN